MSDSEHGWKWWVRFVIVPLIGGGGVIAIVAAFISSPSPPASNSPDYGCQYGSFSDGECLPPKTVTNIEPRLSKKLYLRCLDRGGADEYTSRCCDHLPASLADKMQVC